MREHLAVPVRNFSIGASSSALSLYLLDQLAPAGRGIAFIDYAINDGDFAWNLWGPANARRIIGDNIRTLASRLNAMSYIPVVLVMPSDLDKEQELLGERLHCDICREEGITYFNLHRLFRSLIAAGGSIAALMRDDCHISGSAGELVARFLAEIVDRAGSAAWSQSAQTASVVRARAIPASQFFPAETLVERKSSWRSAPYGRLNLGEVIGIPIGGGERLAGILINMGAKGGTVVIQGAGCEVTKSLTAYWDEAHPDQYSAMLVDIAQTIVGGPSGVTMKIVSSDRAPTERTLHARRVLPNRYGEVEIEGILAIGCDYMAFEFLKQTCAGMPLDLQTAPAAADLSQSLARLRP
jgi:hypothetical protein